MRQEIPRLRYAALGMTHTVVKLLCQPYYGSVPVPWGDPCVSFPEPPPKVTATCAFHNRLRMHELHLGTAHLRPRHFLVDLVVHGLLPYRRVAYENGIRTYDQMECNCLVTRVSGEKWENRLHFLTASSTSYHE